MKKMFLVLFVVLTSSLFSQEVYYEKTLELTDSLLSCTAVQLTDNNFILAGYQRYYLQIIKISLVGEVLWYKELSTDNLNKDTCSHLCAVRDGGFVVTGSKLYNQSEQIVVQKFDSSGTVEWERVFGDTALREIGLEIVQTTDNGFLLTAGIKDVGSVGFFRPVLIKVDSLGNQLWRKEFPNDISPSTLGYRLRKVSATTFVFSQYKSLIFFNETGEITDSLQFEKEIIAFAVNEKKKIAVAFDSSIVLYSVEKNKLWEYPFQGKVNSYLVDGFNGNIMSVQYYRRQFNNKINYLRKFSQDGLLLWEKSQEYFSKYGLTTSDSSYFILGYYRYNLTIKKITKNGVIKHLYNPNLPKYIFTSSKSLLGWYGEDVNAVDIYLSLDSTKTWTLLGEKITEKPFNWSTPEMASSHCFIKLVDSYDSRFFIVSDQFSITDVFDFNGQFIETNNLLYWFYDDGMGGNDPRSYEGGLYWPKSSGVSAVYLDGFLWAGKVNGEIRANGSEWRTGMVPGTISSDGIRSDTTNPKFRIWKIRRGYELLSDTLKARYENQYNNWPGELGAPFVDENHDGIFSSDIDKPYFIGDETAFFVTNDLDTFQSKRFTGTLPIGIEMQQTLYAYKTNDYLDNIVFKNIRIINKSFNTVDSMYVGQWADTDVGEINDDYLGCDSSTNLGYSFNSKDPDFKYGAAPPAVGFQFLKGALKKGTESDSAYLNGKWEKGLKDCKLSTFVPVLKNNPIAPMNFQLGVASGAKELHNLLSGRLNYGGLFINPNTNLPFGNYPFSGDPELKIGDFQGGFVSSINTPGDRSLIISSGPFTFAPGDTQNITVAIFLARGSSNVNSVTKLKETAKLIQNFYNQNLTDVEEEKPSTLPSEFALNQNYPNPFNPETVISYQLTVNSKVSLKVFDILGKEVAVLVNEEKSAGRYQVNFRGSNFASGVYFYQLRAGQYVQTKKFVVLK